MTTAPHTTAKGLDALREADDRGAVYPDTDIPDARPLDCRGSDA
jgi:hypothetical protein